LSILSFIHKGKRCVHFWHDLTGVAGDQGYYFPYPDAAYGWEITMLVMWSICDLCRLFLGQSRCPVLLVGVARVLLTTWFLSCSVTREQEGRNRAILLGCHTVCPSHCWKRVFHSAANLHVSPRDGVVVRSVFTLRLQTQGGHSPEHHFVHFRRLGSSVRILHCAAVLLSQPVLGIQPNCGKQDPTLGHMCWLTLPVASSSDMLAREFHMLIDNRAQSVYRVVPLPCPPRCL
jgi:hypothetical protein